MFVKPLIFATKGIPHVKYEKKLIDNACFFTFFHDCTNRLNLEMEPKYLTKSDIQLNPNILRTKNHKRVLLKALE